MRNYFFLLICVLCACQETAIEPDPIKIEPQDFSLFAPVDGSMQEELQAQLVWLASEGATSYRLTVGTSLAFDEIFFEQMDIEDTTMVLDALSMDQTYYWKVEAMSESDLSVSSEVFHFKTPLVRFASSPNISRYFVAPNGEDTPEAGTEDRPWKSPAYASRLVPKDEGDEIFIKYGSYEITDPILLETGTHLIGESKEGVRLFGTEITKYYDPLEEKYDKLFFDGSMIQLVSPSRETMRNPASKAIAPMQGNQQVRNLTLDGQNKQAKTGLWVENRNAVEIADQHIENMKYRGMVVMSAPKLWMLEPEFYLTDIHLHDLSFKNSGKDLEDESIGNLNVAQLDGALIEDIFIEDDEGYGLKFIIDGYYKNCVFRNIETQLSEQDKLWGEDIGVELWNLGENNLVENVKSNTWLSLVNHGGIFTDKPESGWNLTVRDIEVIDNDGKSSKEGIEIGLPHVDISKVLVKNKGMGIAIWNAGNHNIQIHHSLFINEKHQFNWAGGSGIYIDNSTDNDFNDFRINHNVFDKNVFGIKVKGAKIKKVEITNNLFIDSKTADLKIDGGQLYFSNNFKHQTEWVIDGDPQSAEYNLTGDAMLNGSGDDYQFYTPEQGSPLIDAGKILKDPFNGSAPDIGYVER
ncbi:right-handed parallel beta-helix repeat-containing protein [Persicobacter diffluens]|uniref:Right handed beta helix domain-containing protein n=1 Tax=Persicobacter diffluens TaxID=981 RepID=A0AAN4W2B7_9BACT|nr:hypothetical protein PEDI_50210 [Persicobacter diffluens]